MGFLYLAHIILRESAPCPPGDRSTHRIALRIVDDMPTGIHLVAGLRVDEDIVICGGESRFERLAKGIRGEIVVVGVLGVPAEAEPHSLSVTIELLVVHPEAEAEGEAAGI